jgi:hypothetical protein
MSYGGYGGAPAGPPTLRSALAAVHADGRWWAKCLGYGAAALTGFGLPLAAGFVMESLDNTRRGFPTPLPPWSDPSLRWLTGLFCLLIDFAFFVLPVLVGAVLLLCVSVGLVMTASAVSSLSGAALFLIAGLALVVLAGMFAAGVAPAGRLIFAREGKVEDAISARTLRWALAEPQRGPFLRARLASLPAYLPAALLGGVTAALTPIGFAGQVPAMLVGLWLTLAALVYAHLVTVQLYVAAEHEAQRRALGM